MLSQDTITSYFQREKKGSNEQSVKRVKATEVLCVKDEVSTSEYLPANLRCGSCPIAPSTDIWNSSDDEKHCEPEDCQKLPLHLRGRLFECPWCSFSSTFPEQVWHHLKDLSCCNVQDQFNLNACCFCSQKDFTVFSLINHVERSNILL